MKLLLSCVNSSVSLAGFDWDAGEVFWSLPVDKLRSCGVCYHEKTLLVASDNHLHCFGIDQRNIIPLGGKYASLAHSVHSIDSDSFGVVDTGNSCIRVFDRTGATLAVLEPLVHWGDIPPDAIHMNDFVVTPTGIIASCFDYRPWRKVCDETGWQDWCEGHFGVLINLTGYQGKGAGRIVGCGFDHPHSLRCRDSQIFLCSSASGIFHRLALSESGNLSVAGQMQITRQHFLRGSYFDEGYWYLGGSAVRHGESLAETMAVYRCHEESGVVDHCNIDLRGEIYDILLWDEKLMRVLIDQHFR